MSRSRKRNPGGTYCGNSQHRGKKVASKRFRRKVKVMLHNESGELPVKSIEVTSPYDLGGDGKTYWKDHDERWMRK